MREPITHLGDAGITLALIIALLIGVDVKWVLAVYLGLVFIGELAKAFTSFSDIVFRAVGLKT